MKQPDINGFLAELLNKWAEWEWMDIDGGDMQDMLLKHGLLIERPATEADCETDSGLDYGLQPGDPWFEFAAEIVALRKAHQ